MAIAVISSDDIRLAPLILATSTSLFGGISADEAKGYLNSKRRDYFDKISQVTFLDSGRHISIICALSDSVAPHQNSSYRSYRVHSKVSFLGPMRLCSRA